MESTSRNIRDFLMLSLSSRKNLIWLENVCFAKAVANSICMVDVEGVG